MINIKNSVVQKELKESHFVIKSTVNTKATTTFFCTGILFLSIIHMYSCYHFNSSLVIIRVNKAAIKKKVLLL